MYRRVITLFFLFVTFSICAASPLPVDLTARDAFVREGFRQEWLGALPAAEDRGWVRIPACPGNRPVRIRDLGLPGVPRFSHFSPYIHAPRSFTIVSSFILDGWSMSGRALGLYLGQIGQNWEIYINGRCIAREVHRHADGFIAIERAVRGEVVELPSGLLVVGENILAFRIVGDPTDDRTGFFMGSPYVIDRLETVLDRRGEYVDYMFVAIYLFFGLYHLMLFLLRRREVYNLFFALGTITVAIYVLFRTTLVFGLIQDTVLVIGIERTASFLILASFAAFTDLIVRNRLSLFTKLFGMAHVVMAATQNFVFRESLLRLFQALVPVALLYIMLWNCVVPFAIGVRTRWRSRGGAGILTRIGASIAGALVNTVPGNLLAGSCLVIVTITVDILNMNAGRTAVYTRYGFFLFVMGTAGILANRFIAVHRRMEELNLSLEREVEERTVDLKTARDALWGEMELAKKIQMTLLPQHPAIEGYCIAAHMAPASEVGGDYYDIINAGPWNWLVIGDVSGHGVPAGLIMMMVQTSINVVLSQTPDMHPSELLVVVNRTISENIRRLNEDKYMTITVLACFDGGRFYFAGLHQDIMVYRAASAVVDIIETHGFWIGLMSDIENLLADSVLTLEPDDVMLLYTDGITEAWRKGSVKDFREASEMFGNERLSALLLANGTRTPDEIRLAILHDLEAYQCYDDVTMVVIKRR